MCSMRTLGAAQMQDSTIWTISHWPHHTALDQDDPSIAG
jgi:hypothetical protein